jgi:hypothetical protein
MLSGADDMKYSPKNSFVSVLIGSRDFGTFEKGWWVAGLYSILLIVYFNEFFCLVL